MTFDDGFFFCWRCSSYVLSARYTFLWILHQHYHHCAAGKAEEEEHTPMVTVLLRVQLLQA